MLLGLETAARRAHGRLAAAPGPAADELRQDKGGADRTEALTSAALR